MIQGADKLDISSCSAMKPISGFDPTSKLVMVRNPSYDQASDDLRGNYVDAIDIRVNSNVDDIFNKVLQGSLDGSLVDQPPNTVVRQYLTDESKKQQLHSNEADRTWFISMNLTVPPLDDVHVRKAANLVMDKAGILRAWGGTTFGEIATHAIPPSVLSGTLGQDFDPYASPDFGGDETKAKEEMKQSKYDSNKDGVCDAKECSNLVMINRNVTPWSDAEAVVASSLEKIGIKVKPRELASSAAYTTIQTVKNKIPIALNAGWGKDYPDPYSFAGVLFATDAIIPTGNTNYPLVSLTPEKAQELGVDIPAGTQIPNVSADIENCQKVTEPAERTTCFADLDKKLMEQAVPWVPYLWNKVVYITAPSVTRYEYDQSSGEISFVNTAVNNNATMS